MIDRQTLTDHVTGSLVGAVIGDALGYPANGLTFWQVLRKYNFIDGFYSVGGVFGKYTDQSKNLLTLSHKMKTGASSDVGWLPGTLEFVSQTPLSFASKAIPIGIVAGILDSTDGQVSEMFRTSQMYSDKTDGLALTISARIIGQCIRNHENMTRPFDLFDSPNSVLNKLHALAAVAEDGFVQHKIPMKDSFSERLLMVRSRLMKRESLNSFIGVNGSGADIYESLPLALFAFMNEPDEVKTIQRVASLGNAASQNAALVGAMIGGFLGISYLQDLKDQVENSTKIHVLAAEMVNAFLPEKTEVEPEGDAFQGED